MSYTKNITVKDKEKNTINVLDKPIFEKVFLKDHKRAFLYKKSEKLSQAVHVVLAHVQTENSATQTLATLSMALVGESLHETKDVMSKTVLEIMSALQVCRSADILATANANLLYQEYGYLLALLCEDEKEILTLDLEVEESSPQPAGGKSPLQQAQIAKRQTIDKGHKGQVKDRQQQILAVIKEKGTVSIKDIAKIITDCSEKTIQREINALIERGDVRKEGERRWSTYHFVSQ